MNRRSYLATAGSVVLAGCLSDVRAPGTRPKTGTDARTPDQTGTYASQPAGPERYPDRPGELTRDAAVAYVEEFERVRTYNALHEADVEEIHADSRTVYDTAAHGGHHVLASGSGYANYADGVHADWGQSPALYFVGPSLTVRAADYDDHYFHCSEVFAADDPAENFADACEGDDATYRAYNLHPTPHSLSVTVSLLGDGSPTTVLERRYDLGTTDGLKQGSVTRRRGTYRLTASLDSGPATSYRWTIRSAPTYEDPPVTVLVTPAGAVTVRRPPFPEV